MTPDAAPAPGDVVLRRYRLGPRVGRGGLGVVYRGLDLETGRDVAVKVMHRALSESSTVAARFLREARIARRLEHPAVPRGLAVGVAGRAPVLVVEYVAGRTLRAALEADGALPVVDALRVGARVAEALDAAHRASVIHRDVKPDNVMLADSEPLPDGVRVLDFGLAFVLDEPRLSATRVVVGTPEYLSPEQCRGERVTPAADLYALGATLAHALTGATLFRGDARAQVEAHLRCEPPDLGALRPDLPRDAAAFLASLLRKDPAARPASARDVAATLRALADGAAVAHGTVDDEALRREAEALRAESLRTSAARAAIVEQVVTLAAARIERGDEDVSPREEALERALAAMEAQGRAREEGILARMRSLAQRILRG